MVHAFNPSVWETEVVDLFEAKARLNYIVNPGDTKIYIKSLFQKNNKNKK